MLEVAKPFFSIIIPTLNSDQTLENCLNSLSHQTYKNFEVLIIDGLSSDRTLEIAERFQSQFKNTLIHSQKDRGIYDAMNKGIELSKGKWLYFLGSDDSLYESTTIECVMKNIQVGDEVIYGNVSSPLFNGIYGERFDYLKLGRKNICHQAIFFKREIFEKIGDFNLRYRVLSDWDHNIRWFFSKQISKRYINQIFANYAAGGYSSKNRDPIFEDELKNRIFFKSLGKVSFWCLLKYYNEQPKGDYKFLNKLYHFKRNLCRLKNGIKKKIITILQR